MRRFLFGVVIASVTAAMPVWAFGGDREIAKSVMTELQQHKASGQLKGFDIDLRVEEGIVYLTGEVSSQAQLALVAGAAENAVGAANLVNELSVKGAKQLVQPVQPAASTQVPTQPTRADAAVTDAIIGQLQQSKANGMLRGFELDVSTVGGDVWLRGKVSTQDQKDHVINIARRIRGVSRVIDDVTVAENNTVRQVSTGALVPAAAPATAPAPITEPGPAPVPVSSMPVVGGTVGPQPIGGPYAAGTPMPMQGAMASYGAGAPRYDQPNMPSYAWPSYAAAPNYAAVTYPQQYSPSAWPYIGPFYPYPQVPLGWRKVALEWDDGLWYLDFTSK